MDKLDSEVIEKTLREVHPPKRVRVSVTERHIAAGVRGSGNECPIALALTEMGFSFPGVGMDYATLDGRQAQMPTLAVEFIRNFDNCGSVHPITFDLELEDQDG